MRLFVAIELPGDVAEHLGRMQEGLRGVVQGRWVPRGQLHLTLKFLRETPEERVGEILKALRGVEIDQEISLRTKEVACFPERGRVRVVAAGMEDADGRCERLRERIDRVCHEQGFALEGRRWMAHVTLARLKDGGGERVRERAAEAVAGLLPGPVFGVEEFAVIQSRLERRGAVYVRVG